MHVPPLAGAIARCPIIRVAILGVALFAGCASTGPPVASEPIAPADLACAAFIDGFDADVERAATGEGGATRIPRYRTLRLDRLLAGYAHQPMDAGQFGSWIAAMRALDRHARGVELDNLPAADRARIDARARSLPSDASANAPSLAARIDACAERVLALDLAVPHAREGLIAAAKSHR